MQPDSKRSQAYRFAAEPKAHCRQADNGAPTFSKLSICDARNRQHALQENSLDHLTSLDSVHACQVYAVTLGVNAEPDLRESMLMVVLLQDGRFVKVDRDQPPAPPPTSPHPSPSSYSTVSSSYHCFGVFERTEELSRMNMHCEYFCVCKSAVLLVFQPMLCIISEAGVQQWLQVSFQ